MQELVDARFLFPELLDKKALLITQPFALERGLDPGPQQIRVERLLHVVVSAELDAAKHGLKSSTAETMITGTSRSDMSDFICSRAATPSISGIWTSSSTRSKGCRA